MLQRDLRRVFGHPGPVAARVGHERRRHCGRHADFTLTAHFGPGDARVVLGDEADRSRCEERFTDGAIAYEHFMPQGIHQSGHDPGGTTGRRGDDGAVVGVLFRNGKGIGTHDAQLAHLRALARAGVDSIKIEGRNKKAFYVATVVGAYRRVLDGEPPEAVADELLAVSHRPYGTGFYFSEAEQATAYDGYEQETMHVADVVASSPCHPERSAQREVEVEGFPDDPQYLYLLCRNRFAEGDELETLVPHEPSRRLIVRDLHWLNTFGPDNHDEDAPATVEEALSRATATDWEPAAAANRSCNLYRILVENAALRASDGSTSAAPSVSDKVVCDELAPSAIPEGSFLRKRTFRRSARHEDKERL